MDLGLTRRSVTFMSVLWLVAPLVPSGFVSEQPRQSLLHAAQAPAVGEALNAAGHPGLFAAPLEITTARNLLRANGWTRLILGAQEPEPQRSGECPRITLRPMTLAYNIDEFAGQRVRILDARVVQVFEPRAFVIEPATRYTMYKGLRDRVLVLIDAGTLRLPSEALGGSTVTILGNAHTLLGARVSPEVSWPRALDPNLIEHLEVRAAILATSVQTPDGTELTEPVGRGPSPTRGC
jgi:hypothetical protein